ncbi:branched-chain amino acid ABC transporter permease [Microbacterium sp. NPDC058062]|uniref:branched-chain amino acid ABC transporter permease n=1 Tax=Microbacterium sp. NPDC058062 TaxID=3346320 RepID=UPI0036DB3CE5
MTIAIVAVVLVGLWVVTPLILDDSTLTNLAYSGIFAIAAVGLVLLSGYGGQSSFAQPAFMLIGAYTTVNLGAVLQLPMALYLLAAVALAGLIGAAVGVLALRLEGQQLAIVTLGVLLVSQYIAYEATELTGGENGRSAAGASRDLFGIDLAALGGFTSSQSEFWVVWAIVALVAWASMRLLRQRPGQALISVRENAAAASALGVDVRREKLKAFTWASALGGLAGALYAAFQQYATPSDFGLLPAVLLLAMLVIGGSRSVVGTIIGALLVWGGKQWVSDSASTGGVLSWLVKVPGSTEGLMAPGDLVTFIFGIAIIVVLLVSPAGLAGIFTSLRTRARRSRRASTARVQA